MLLAQCGNAVWKMRVKKHMWCFELQLWHIRCVGFCSKRSNLLFWQQVTNDDNVHGTVLRTEPSKLRSDLFLQHQKWFDCSWRVKPWWWFLMQTSVKNDHQHTVWNEWNAVSLSNAFTLTANNQAVDRSVCYVQCGWLTVDNCHKWVWSPWLRVHLSSSFAAVFWEL